MWHAWGRIKVFAVLVGKSERKRPLGRPRYRRKDGIRIYLTEFGRGVVKLIQLALNRDR
jgi:hypothetical protein